MTIREIGDETLSPHQAPAIDERLMSAFLFNSRTTIMPIVTHAQKCLRAYGSSNDVGLENAEPVACLPAVRPVHHGRLDELAAFELLVDETIELLGKVPLGAPHYGNYEQDNGDGHQAQPKRLFEHPLRQWFVRYLLPARLAPWTCDIFISTVRGRE